MKFNLITFLKISIYVLIIGIVIAAGLVINSAMTGDGSDVLRTEAEKAVQVAEKAVKAAPNDALARAKLAAAYLSVGRYSDALKQAEYAIKLNPDEGTGYLVAGIANRELGNYDKAIEMINRALQDKNKTADWKTKAYIELALSYEKKGELKKARDALTNAISNFPEGADLYFERARIFEKLGNLEAAYEDYKAVLTFTPSDERAKKAVERLEKQIKSKETTQTTETTKK